MIAAFIIILALWVTTECVCVPAVLTKNIKNDSAFVGVFGLTIVVSVLSFAFGVITNDIKSNDVPRAIDVYRGNTDLKVTTITENGVVVEQDSVVIFKNE